jgi:hypothetical protein
MSQIYDVADVIIEGDEIILTDFSGCRFQNIFNLVQSIDIFESIYNHTLQADFYIGEGIELLNYFPVAGEEFIKLSFRTPNRKLLTYEFMVESIVGQKANDQSNSKRYMLRCVTRDLLTNSYKLYSKRYTNMDYKEAVGTVINTDLGSSKSVNIEDTKGKFDYVVNAVRPFQVISLICERAKSAKYQSSVFYFYEDNEGYHFTTIEKLIEERKGGADKKEFKLVTDNRAKDYALSINHRNILSYETISQGSTIEKVRDGAMYIQVREFDIMTGDYYTKYEYKNPSDHTQFKETDKNEDFNSSIFNSTVTKFPAVSRMTVKDGTRPDMKHNETIVYRRAFNQRISQYGLRLRVYGDTDIRVGDVIKASLRDISGVTVDPEQQKIYSENYIVVEMKHRLDQKENKTFEHYMILDVRKPNMYSAIG